MKVETLKARQHNLHLVTEWLDKTKLGFGLDTSQMTQLGCAIIDYVKDNFPGKKNIDTENKNACPKGGEGRVTAIVLMPVLFMRDDEEKLDCSLNPERQRQKLDSLLAQGFKVKIANEFEYEHIHFTHYVLEKETKEND